MPDKKDCCNKGAALEALQWVIINKKAWAVLLMIARVAPQAIVRAVAELTCPTTNAPKVWVCSNCRAVIRIPNATKCVKCGNSRLGPA